MSEAPKKFVPQAVPETAIYWEKARQGELWIQRCDACGVKVFYPRLACPACASDELAWIKASGRATLYSYVINARPAPGWEGDVPYVIAVVELEEGPRMMTNIVGAEPSPQALTLDMPLEVHFEVRGDMSIPVFRVAEGAQK